MDKLIGAIRRYAFRRFPLLFFKLRTKESLAWYRDRDAEKNRTTTPTDDEKIELHCLWAVEFYTAAHAEQLAISLADLGWDDPDQGNNNPCDWLKKSRDSSESSGWINLGFIRPSTSSRRSIWPERTGPIPDDFEYAQAHLFNLTSSVTCMVARFQFKADRRKSYDDVLRNEYTTYAKPLSIGYTFLDPYSQKEKAISQIRVDARIQVQQWFSEIAPGIFSGGIEQYELPTCEFVTFKKAEPFGKSTQGKIIDDYLSILEMRGDWDCWVAKELPELKFGWPLLKNRNDFHSVLALNESNLNKVNLESYGGPNAAAYIARIDLEIKTMLTRWGCVRLLEYFERRLNRTRDAKAFRSLDEEPLHLLHNLHSVLIDSIDTAVLAPELQTFSNERGWFDHEIPDFKSSHSFLNAQVFNFKDVLRNNIAAKAKRLAAADRAVKDLLLQQGNLVSASENIKLQRRLGTLTIILTLLTLFMAYEPLSKLFSLIFSTEMLGPG